MTLYVLMYMCVQRIYNEMHTIRLQGSWIEYTKKMYLCPDIVVVTFRIKYILVVTFRIKYIFTILRN